MSLNLHQHISANGYITDRKFLYGTVRDFEINLGYQYGRLKEGFFIAHLLSIPQVTDFELAGYSITPQHRFRDPERMDITKLKQIAREAMTSIGYLNLVKVFPNTRHNDDIDPDEQYPFGRGGIPQWRLKNDLQMYIFKEVPKDYNGYINL